MILNTNKLNDLDGKEWVKSTKSVWGNINKTFYGNIKSALKTGILLSESPQRDIFKKNHPATFSEKDISKLILFFTKSGETVLDPFLGSGSTGVSAVETGRNFIGIELYPEWHSLSQVRIEQTKNSINNNVSTQIFCGESLEIMNSISEKSIDFIVTSPPYWGILEKQDHKAKKERLSKGLSTDYGKNELDLSLIHDYKDFLNTLLLHCREYYRLLKFKRYAAIIVSDFRHGQKYYMFHSDIADLMLKSGFIIQGLITLVQDNKKLYPYGYPTTYVPNISNQFIIIGRKLS